MKYARWFAITSCLLALSACSPYDIEKNYREATLSPTERSYFIGRFAVQCDLDDNECSQHINTIEAIYRSTDGAHVSGRLVSVIGHDPIKGGNITYDFVDADKHEKGFYFCELVPQGKFEFYTFDYNGGGQYFFLKKDNWFSLPFSASPDEIVYVGRIKITTTPGKNIFGQQRAYPGSLLLSQDPVNDIAKAVQKCPASVQSLPVRQAAFNKSMAIDNPIVQLEKTE